ncbi:MAG: UxaA family hydrolase [Deltaproteobacteria bacterium]|nr:UxaA family hydrolase [Deltaproteobacteria bacterium]
MIQEFWGYRRKDRKFGIRNYVAIISAMDNSNPTVRRVASIVRGTQAVCPTFGRGSMGPDLDQHLRTVVNIGTNPNVYGAVVISLFRSSAEEIAQSIAKTGRPVEAYAIEEDGGTANVANLGVRAALQLMGDAGRQRREPMPWSELVLGMECGGSDGSSGIVSNPVTGMVADMVVDRGGTVIMSETVEILGAEHLVAARAKDPATKQKLLEAVNFCVTYAKEVGVDLLGANPAPDNIIGGLSTIEEKALGAIKKGGSRPLMEVIGYGHRPTKKGFVIMDAPAPGVENVTALAAGGTQAIIFSTGKGNPSGHPIVPTIKVSGNPFTVELLKDNLDVDLSAVITKGMSLADAANILEQELVDVCWGKPTRADLLGETEVAISRLCRTV